VTASPGTTTASGPGGWTLPEGLPLTLFAALALVATASGRLLSPALFGSGTGLDAAIMAVQAIGNVTSQAVAVGGVAFAVLAVRAALGRPGLGIAYRMVVVPAAVAASVLAIFAMGRVLEPSRANALAVASLVSLAAGVPIALGAPASRALGLVLGLTAISGAIDFAGLSVAASAIERGSAASYRVGEVLMTIGFVIEFVLVAVAIAFITGGDRRRSAVLGLASAVLAFALAYVVHRAAGANASTAEIVVARAVGALLRAPPPFVPSAARLMLEVGGLVGAVAALFTARRAPLAPLVALCLTARGSPDVPIPALLLVVAGIAVPAYATTARRRA